MQNMHNSNKGKIKAVAVFQSLNFFTVLFLCSLNKTILHSKQDHLKSDNQRTYYKEQHQLTSRMRLKLTEQ